MEEIHLLMQKAKRFLASSQLLLSQPDVESACSRGYYAMFYATQALLLSKGLSPKTHKGVRTAFAQVYIQGGILPVSMSKDLSFAADMRSAGDYEINQIITLNEAQEVVKNTESFLQKVADYLNEGK